MKENNKTAVRQILTKYLDDNKLRKTPERFAVLDAVYSFNGHFSIQELSEKIEEDFFPVSRATLYNALNLFVSLHLVVCHRLSMGTMYQASYESANHCYQVCTACGKVAEIKAPKVEQALDETRLNRFRRDSYSLYVYGVCNTCVAKITRKKNKKRFNS